MVKYLLKSTEEIFVLDEQSANELHKEIEAFAHENNYTLSSWSQTLKEKKAQGEVIDSWVICKYVLVFNDAKEPEIPLKDIQYNMDNREEF